jgi:hypothetical protein
MKMANTVMEPANGVLTNISKLPLEISMDCLKLVSAMSPSTKANTKGARGYLSFLKA